MRAVERGADVSERLYIVSAQFRVIITRRQKDACRSFTHGVMPGPSSARLIPGGMPTVAHVIVGKYAKHLPLYRQAQIYSFQGVDLDRSTLADWVVLLEHEGWVINVKKVYRIYRELGIQLRNKTPKRRGKAKPRDDRAEAVGPNEVWAMDFVHDQLATRKKLRTPTVVDTFSRYILVLDARFSYRGEDVVATLDRIFRMTSYPKTIRVDQGSEFISKDMDLWGYQRGCLRAVQRWGSEQKRQNRGHQWSKVGVRIRPGRERPSGRSRLG